MGLVSRFLSPEVDRRLLADQGEFVIDEVEHHWIVTVPWVAGIVGTLPVLWYMPALGRFWWVGLAVAVVVLCYCLARIHQEHMDRFVITNMRVFRVHGVLSQSLATMPMTRILDISVHQPFLGRLLNFGHFVFESAAQDQGLRDIRYVGHPDERDLTIQRVIQRAGLRAKVQPLFTEDEYLADDDDEDFSDEFYDD